MTKDMIEFYTSLITIIIDGTIAGRYKWDYFPKKHSILYKIEYKNFLFEVQPQKSYFVNQEKMVDTNLCDRLRKAIIDSKPIMVQSGKKIFINDNPFEKLYKQVPYSENSGKCPFCDGESILKPTEIIICKEPNFTKRVRIPLAYCIRCEIASADKKICAHAQSENDSFYIPVFKEKSLKHAKRILQSYESTDYAPGHTVRVIEQQKEKGVKREEKSLSTKGSASLNPIKIDGKFFTAYAYIEKTGIKEQKYDFVTHNRRKLIYDYYNNEDIESIRVKMPCFTENNALAFNANYNSKRRKTYIDESLVDEIVKAFSDYKGNLYRINGRFLSEIIASRELKKYISRMTVSSQVFLMIVRYGNGDTREYCIVNDRNDVDHKEYKYHYSEEIARELLTAAYYEDRHKRANLFNTDVIVEKVISKMPEKGNGKSVFMPLDIILKSDGGLGSSVKNSTKEIITSLLYSPYTGRYECLNMTYDKVNDFCYVDPGVFRKHLHDYGNPGLPFRLEGNDTRGNGSFYSELNTESVLFNFGYNVSESQGLSEKTRRDILADVMDLEILTAAKIISLIEFFISSHSSDRYERARNKWRSDIAFVRQYHVNPERFLIIGKNSAVRR